MDQFIVIVKEGSISTIDILKMSMVNHSWRQMVNSNLRLLSEHFLLPYTESAKELWLLDWKSANDLLIEACKRNDVRMVRCALTRGAAHIGRATYAAAKHNNKEIIDMIRKDTNHDENLVDGALRAGHLDLLLSIMSEEKIVKIIKRKNLYCTFASYPQIASFIEKNKISVVKDLSYTDIPEHLRPIISRKIGLRDAVQLYCAIRFNLPERDEMLTDDNLVPKSRKLLEYCFKHNKCIGRIVVKYNKVYPGLVTFAAIKYHKFQYVTSKGLDELKNIDELCCVSPVVINYLIENNVIIDYYLVASQASMLNVRVLKWVCSKFVYKSFYGLIDSMQAMPSVEILKYKLEELGYKREEAIKCLGTWCPWPIREYLQ